MTFKFSHSLYFFLAVIFSTVISAFTVIALLHTCFVNQDRSAFIDMICGDMGQFNGSSSWLSLDDIESVYSNNIPENIADRKAEKLVDGSKKTVAHAGSNKFDYIVELTDEFYLKKVELYWGDFGLLSTSGHLDKWFFEIKSKSGDWVVVVEDKTPDKEVSIINVNQLTSGLRVRAEAEKAWIGIYELKIMGKSK